MKNKEKKYQYGYRQIYFSNNINLHCIYTNFCIELFVKKHTFEPIFALNYLFKNLKLALSWNMSFKTLVFTKGESKKFQNSIIFRKFFTFISQGDERVLSAIKSNGRYNPFRIHPLLLVRCLLHQYLLQSAVLY